MPKGIVEYKTLPFELKGVTEEGEFSGHAATFDIDLGNDRIWPGAFKKTIKGQKTPGKFKLLFQHQMHTLIGHVFVKEDNTGLLMDKGKLNLMLTQGGQIKVPKAHETHALMLTGDLDEVSIGYDPIIFDDERTKKNGVIRNLREIRLWEISPVTFAMNPNATITDVKTRFDLQNILQAIEDGSLSEEQIKQILALFEPTSKVIQTVEPVSWEYTETMKQLKKLKEVFLND